MSVVSMEKQALLSMAYFESGEMLTRSGPLDSRSHPVPDSLTAGEVRQCRYTFTRMPALAA